MALFNNGFPMTYQQYYPAYQQPTYQVAPQMAQPAQQPQQQPMPQPTPQPMNSSIIWVQGEAGAKSYLVAPNNTVQLWDSEKQTIYLKSADASGMPSMKILDYTIRENQPVSAPAVASNTAVSQPNNSPAYATKADVEALYGQISGIRAEIDSLTIKKAPAKPKKEVTEDDE